MPDAEKPEADLGKRMNLDGLSNAALFRKASDAIGTALFDETGGLIGLGQGPAEFEVALLSGTEILVRFAEMAGLCGDWSFDVSVD